MKKLKFLIIFFNIIFFDSFVKAESNFSLQSYLDKSNIEKVETQIYLLNRCSAVYAYASGIILKSDAVNSEFYRNLQ